MAITRAQQAAMPRRTATEIAEEAYEARQALRRYPDITGPAGVLIPDPRSAYRPSLDPKILTAIAHAQHADFRATLQSPEREAEMQAVLAAALEKAAPVADMEVLRRYNVARITGRVSVAVGIYGFDWVTLPGPMLLPVLPPNTPCFRTSNEGPGIDLPEAAFPWFDGKASVADNRKDIPKIQHWPNSFKATAGRWPFWREIEAAWPRLAAWMAKERAAA